MPIQKTRKPRTAQARPVAGRNRKRGFKVPTATAKPVTGRAARAVTTARINKIASKGPKFTVVGTKKGGKTAIPTKTAMKTQALRGRGKRK